MKDEEVDLIAELDDRAVPFEVKYQDAEIGGGKLKGLRHFIEKYDIEQGYVITLRSQDFGALKLTSTERGRENEILKAQIMAIPAALACYWLSEA
jgi:hypothetical protein